MPEKNESLTQKARQLILSADHVPAPSPLLFRIIELMQDEKADVRDFKDLFTRDPGLSSCILRMANSAYYGYRGRVKDLERAIILIGFDEIKNICVTAVIIQQFAKKDMSSSFMHDLFWKHSLLVGILSKELAARCEGKQWCAGPYYTMGLLHDFGRLIIAAFLADYFDEILQRAEKEGIGLFEAERELGLTHTQVGYWLASKWGFPAGIRHVIACHHESDAAGKYSMETAVVRLANQLARYAQEPGNTPVPDPDRQDLKASCLELDDYKAQADRIFDILSGVDGFYDALQE